MFVETHDAVERHDDVGRCDDALTDVDVVDDESDDVVEG